MALGHGYRHAHSRLASAFLALLLRSVGNHRGPTTLLSGSSGPERVTQGSKSPRASQCLQGLFSDDDFCFRCFFFGKYWNVSLTKISKKKKKTKQVQLLKGHFAHVQKTGCSWRRRLQSWSFNGLRIPFRASSCRRRLRSATAST